MPILSASSGPAPGDPERLAGSRLPRGLAAFRHRNYRLFFTGQLISVTGTWMQTLAQAWVVLSLTSSALLFSVVSVLQFAPVFFLGLFAGVVADRLPKRDLLVVTQSLACLLATIMTILVATNRITLWEVYALAFSLGLVNAFDMPTRQAFVVDMVGREDLVNAIALNSSLFNVARILGPSLAGLLLAWKGAAWCFGIDASSYLAVICGLLAMRAVPPVVRRSGSGLHQLREGFNYVRHSNAVLMPVVIAALVGMFGMNFNVWIPLLAKHQFRVGAGGFGILMASLGAGSLVGAMYLAVVSRKPRPKAILLAAGMLGAVEIALATAAQIPTPVVIALLLLPFMGFAMTCTGAMANTMVQTSSPEEMRGRVMSVYMMFFAGAAPAGSFLVGAIANWWGNPSSIAIGGSMTVIVTLAIAYRFGVIGDRRAAGGPTRATFAEGGALPSSRGGND